MDVRFGAEPGIGEIFDHHCVQYTYGDGSFSFSECRQQPGTWSNFSHHAHGRKGYVDFDGNDGVVIHLLGTEPKRLKPGRDGHQTEWDDLIAAVIAGKPYNEVDSAADSTMTAILGRMATYSGQLVTWDEAVKSSLTYGPDRFAWDAARDPSPATTASTPAPCRASPRHSDPEQGESRIHRSRRARGMSLPGTMSWPKVPAWHWQDSSVNHFDGHGDSLPAADAEGRDASPAAGFRQAVQQCNHEPRTTTANGVAKRYGTAVDVGLRRWQPDAPCYRPARRPQRTHSARTGRRRKRSSQPGPAAS